MGNESRLSLSERLGKIFVANIHAELGQSLVLISNNIQQQCAISFSAHCSVINFTCSRRSCWSSHVTCERRVDTVLNLLPRRINKAHSIKHTAIHGRWVLELVSEGGGQGGAGAEGEAVPLDHTCSRMTLASRTPAIHVACTLGMPCPPLIYPQKEAVREPVNDLKCFQSAIIRTQHATRATTKAHLLTKRARES